MRVGPGQRALLNHVNIAFENGTAHALDVDVDNGAMRVRPAPEVPIPLGCLAPGTVVEVSNRVWRAGQDAALLVHADEVARRYRMRLADSPPPPQIDANGIWQWLRGDDAREHSVPDHDEQRARERERAVQYANLQRERARELDRLTRAYERWNGAPQPERATTPFDELLRFLHDAGSAPADTFDATAIDRARALLRRNLTVQQRKQFDRYGSFVVIGNQSQAHYTIKSTGRVIRQTDQREFCLQVVGEPVPPEDAMLARKLLIESNEALFLSTANDLTEPRRAMGDSDLDRLRRQAQREAWHRAQAAAFAAPPPEIPDPSFAERLRALYQRSRG